MNQVIQHRAPVHEALLELRKRRIVPFDVPGHKRGRGNPELLEFLGDKCMSVDVNSMKLLDNLVHPISVIKEAEDLTADAFGAEHAFFMVNGTTSAVQAMIFYAVHEGDEIILPRNVHKSVINALILNGGIPVYVPVEVNTRIGIATGMSLNAVKKAVAEHPNAKGIFVNNPTYYGIASDLRQLVKIAHDAGMLLLADEAHGTHLYFGEGLPINAMAAGADIAAVSMHKSGGSLTQSSILLTGPGIDAEQMQTVINLTQTTSASYLLMASLDISRRNLALSGRDAFARVSKMAEYAREEINDIGGYYAYGRELVDGDSVHDFDVTKLSVYTQGIGLTGIEVYDILRDEYDIQIEFGDIGNILAYISIGDRMQDIERLVGALEDIKRVYGKSENELYCGNFIQPDAVYTPKQAFYAKKKTVDLAGAAGQISGELVMCYPPGIPILTPGERITDEIIKYTQYSKEKGCSLMGTRDPECLKIEVIEGGDK